METLPDFPDRARPVDFGLGQSPRRPEPDAYNKSLYTCIALDVDIYLYM